MFKKKFPADFLWGTATSSHQVEGDNINNNWHLFEQKEGNILDNAKSGKASCHYELFEQDFQYARQLNNNAHRFSVEWSRIEPREGFFDEAELNHYKEVLISLEKYNMQPMLTLHHFTDPIWVTEQGGWENPRTVKNFIRFVAYVVKELKDYVKFWITINEPLVYIHQGYITGTFPPGNIWDIEKGMLVFVNMIKAHAGAYKTIHDMDKEAQVSIASHFAIFDPSNRLNPLDHLMTAYYNHFINYSFINSIMSGKVRLILPDKKFPFFTIRKFDIPDIKNTLDFIGLNYYTRYFVNSARFGEMETKEDSPKNDLGWEIYPEGIYRALLNLKKYKLPIYITENGTPDKNDKFRKQFIVDHLNYVLDAIKKGIDVKGYFYWSLMDNFEWHKGYQHFGLLKINFDEFSSERHLTRGAEAYAEIARNNALNNDNS